MYQLHTLLFKQVLDTSFGNCFENPLFFFPPISKIFLNSYHSTFLFIPLQKGKAKLELTRWQWLPVECTASSYPSSPAKLTPKSQQHEP